MTVAGLRIDVVGDIRRPEDAPDLALPVVAAAGRSNVGKSSLLNCLLGRNRLLRTSRTPGCTRKIQLVAVGAPEVSFVLADLPGYGYAALSKERRDAWGPLIEGFLERSRRLAAVLVLVDVRRGPEREEDLLVQYLGRLGVEPIFVLTKCDKLQRSKAKIAVERIRARFAPARAIATSATTGDGTDALWNAIVRRVAGSGKGGDPPPGAGRRPTGSA